MVDYMYKSRVIIYFVLFGLLSLGTYKIIDICVNQKDKYTRLYNVTVNSDDTNGNFPVKVQFVAVSETKKSHCELLLPY